jgi:hypothetical protein
MRFYFDIHDDYYSAQDEQGIDLANAEAARQHANKVATSVACDVFEASGSQLTVTVRDGTRPLFALVLTLSLRQFTPPESSAASAIIP